MKRAECGYASTEPTLLAMSAELCCLYCVLAARERSTQTMHEPSWTICGGFSPPTAAFFGCPFSRGLKALGCCGA